ncbi:acyl CoA--acetate/3-ketoacid CoA transferase subunit alpha [Yinghuangia sp. ASG 101]|uniref:CoA transferase subunit A n=1 Tax=Yinghuangia sp. ASG 101 TaxID=2896848 RepID=UPI001E461C5D|nr:CoA-transferase [Yinghuangia sp. ASG 101]UGQ09273.1 acyl CoA--acetate/3-ketoacid CoA transferase subunit alpha [Yinghuangia sp. ASG 101]
MADKRMTADEVVDRLDDGMTVGIGGWGSRRKPMALVRAILRSPLRGLTIVAYGGPDIGLLARAGKADKIVYAFVSLDSIPLEPNFRHVRENGLVDAVEYDEGMFLSGLRAAAYRLPFLPTRAGLGSDIPVVSPHLRTVTSPYDDGERLIAMPALRLDAALVHANVADEKGNAALTGPDQYMDELFCLAADKAYVSAERVVGSDELRKEAGCVHTLVLHRYMTAGVVEAPHGAHFTECPPEYGRDEAFQKAYATAAGDPARWAAFEERFLKTADEAAYQAEVAKFREEDGR